ncbi:MAG: hypothetical protein AAF039_07165 [Bacteroidota bacterium]
MSRNLFLLLFVFALLVSCSTDNPDNSVDDNQIGMEDDGMMEGDEIMDDDSADDDMEMEGVDLVGLWVLSEIRLDDNVNDITLEFLDLVIDDLVEQECYLISFNFMDDGVVEVESRVGDFEVEGIEITCPEEVESVVVGWELNGDQLTLIDAMQESETITITLEDEDTFVLEGEEGIDEEFDGSQAVFVRL